MRPIYAALVVAVLAVLFAWLQRSDTAGSMGPPPRLVLSRPILVECEDRLKKVRIRTNDMPSREFLLAAYVMVTIFDVMPGMGVVKSDIQGNIDKIWRRQTSSSVPLLQMCDDEISALDGDVSRARQRDGSVCTSLLWLKRALRLVEGILQQLVRHAGKSLRECANAAYASSLRLHHNFVMRSTFSVALNASPSRAEFMRKLSDETEADTLKTISRVVPSFTKLLDLIERHLVAQRIETR